MLGDRVTKYLYLTDEKKKPSDKARGLYSHLAFPLTDGDILVPCLSMNEARF